MCCLLPSECISPHACAQHPKYVTRNGNYQLVASSATSAEYAAFYCCAKKSLLTTVYQQVKHPYLRFPRKIHVEWQTRVYEDARASVDAPGQVRHGRAVQLSGKDSVVPDQMVVIGSLVRESRQ